MKFLTAEASLRRGERARFAALREELEGYPLLVYLHFDAFMGALPARTPGEWEVVAAALHDTPLEERARTAWLREMARRGSWQDFITAFRPTRSEEMRCLHARARFETGDPTTAFHEARNLWLVPYSQHEACDRIFDLWQRERPIGADLAFKRARLAMDAGHRTLVAYLVRFLDEERRGVANTWLELRRDPTRVAERSSGPPSLDSVLAGALQRLAYRDPPAAVAAWERLAGRRALSTDASDRIRRDIGLAFSYHRRYPESDRWLATIPAPKADAAVRRAALVAALAARDWPMVVDRIGRLPTLERETEQWRYWRARGLDGLGAHEEARALWATVALERSYYGFLSADRLDAGYSLNAVPLDVSPDQIRRFEAAPGFRRARELEALGRTIDRRREWRELTQADGPALAVAAKVADTRGWHDSAILTLARSGRIDDLEVRFPLAFKAVVLARAVAGGLDPAWVFATARQESAFMPDARSTAGALGLMQLMPATGREIARSLDVSVGHELALLDVDRNLRLGVAYLGGLLARFGHPALATAAYNAGPGRVRQWLPTQGPMDADIWIETVPFDETRSYIKRVMTYRAIYQARLGTEITRLRDIMPPIPNV